MAVLKSVGDLKMTQDEIDAAIADGRVFIEDFGRHYITEYTYAGLVTFSNGFRSPRPYGTGRIIVELECE